MKNSIRKLRAFVHKHPLLEFPVFFLWGLFTIIRAQKIFKRGGQHSEPSKNYTVIIPSVRTYPFPGLIYFEAIFAHAFQKCGAAVKLLFHDGMLASTDAETIYRTEKAQSLTAKLLGSWLKKALCLPHASYWDYVTQEDIHDIENTISALPADKLTHMTYCGVEVGLHANASTIRYFLTGMINLSFHEHERIFRQRLRDAMITALVAHRVVEKERPAVLFTLHGVYSTWGPFLDYFQSQKIDTVIYGLITSFFGHFIFCRNTRVSELTAPKSWEVFSTLALTDEENKAVDDYFASRVKEESGEQQLYKARYEEKEPKHILMQKLGENSYVHRYIFYPNLAWDVAVAGSVSEIFEDLFDMIDTLIAFFKEHSSYQLIIKPHPAELLWEDGTQSISVYVHEKHNPLPDNIVLLSPDTPLNPYELAQKTQAFGITFNGTLGLELPVLGIPTLVASEKIHYAQAGVRFPIHSKEDFIAALLHPDELSAYTKNMQKKAKKYAYFLYIASTIPIPFYRKDTWSTLDWRVIREIEKLMDQSSPIIKICHKIIQGEDIVNPL